MKVLKYIYALSIALVFFIGCAEDDNDLSFVDNLVAPSNVSANFQITQDNSGLVKITPNAIGASHYNIVFGDGTTEPTTIVQGESAEHIFPEGTYNLTIQAIGLSGLISEIIQELVVSFSAPENLVINTEIDPTNPFLLNVSATADLAASFLVYFDTSNLEEEPMSLQVGETVSFEYPTVGDYTVRVVALSGGAETTELTNDITISSPVELPINFEVFDATKFIGFGGASAEVVDNPDANGNISSKVGKIVKGGPEIWAGDVIITSAPIDFSSKKIIKLDVWSPRPGGKLLFKIEDLDDNTQDVFIEKEVTLVGNSQWEEVLIDFSDIDLSYEYQKLAWFFDFGDVGEGTDDWTFYVDNIKQVSSASGPSVLPITFDAPFELSSFDGGEISVVDNPDANVNSSSTVAKLVKGSGQVWAGSKITINDPFVIEEGVAVTAKVWSSRAGLELLMKFEDATPWPDTIATDETIATTTVAGGWEELTFTITNVNPSVDYVNLVLIMDNGTSGDGSDNYTIYIDDISVESFLDFEAQQELSSFDGGEISVVANPDTNGNSSAMVGKLVKGSGQVWAGSKITVDEPFPIENSTTITMKVWSPRAGLDLLMKFEDATPWPDTIATDETIATTTVAGGWEELTFTITNVDLGVDYVNLVLIIDNGTNGDGSSNYTIYIDDISNN